MNPQMTDETAEALIDWCYAAMTYSALQGRRVVIFGHDSTGDYASGYEAAGRYAQQAGLRPGRA